MRKESIHFSFFFKAAACPCSCSCFIKKSTSARNLKFMKHLKYLRRIIFHSLALNKDYEDIVNFHLRFEVASPFVPYYPHKCCAQIDVS